MKPFILFAPLFCTISTQAQAVGDTIAGLKNTRDTLIPKAMAPMLAKITSSDSLRTLQYTQGSQITGRTKEFNAIYSLTAGDSITIDYSNAGFSNILSKQISADSPLEIFSYKLLAITSNSLTVKILKAVNTAVQLTGTTVAPYAAAGPQPNGKLNVSIKGL